MTSSPRSSRKSVSAAEAERQHVHAVRGQWQRAGGKVRAVNTLSGLCTPRDSFGDFDVNDGFIQSPRMSLSGIGNRAVTNSENAMPRGHLGMGNPGLGFQAALEMRLNRIAGNRDRSAVEIDEDDFFTQTKSFDVHGKQNLCKTKSVDFPGLQKTNSKDAHAHGRGRAGASKQSAAKRSRVSRVSHSHAGNGIGSKVRRSSFAVILGSVALAATASIADGVIPSVSVVEARSAAAAGGAKVPVVITDEMREEYTSDFVAFDSDRNNVLDAQEVTANFQGQVKPREMHEFFRTADKNMDGKVSLAEYIDYAADLTAENQKQEL